MKSKNSVARITFLFAMTYMVSYMTRINYGAVIAEIEKATDISRSLLSMALTGSFITYGAGQIVSGIVADRLSPKKIITTGLLITVMMNLIIPVCGNPYSMLVVWCINGFAQSMMWPPMVRLMTELMTDEEYKLSAARVSFGGNFGTIAIYLITPLIITFFSWKAVFAFSAVCGIVMLLLWVKLAPDIACCAKSDVSAARKSSGKSFSAMLIGVAAAIILQGMLRDGVTTWMPSYISDTYKLSNGVSILTGVLMPIFGIVCIEIATRLYVKRFKNPLSCAGAIFGVGAVSSFALWILNGTNAALSVLFSALLTGCMHGVNLILICMIPPFFKKNGQVSTVSGMLNACTYIGSAVSAYGIALISETYGWNITVFLWLCIAAIGFVLCMLLAKPWRKKFNREI